MKLIYTFSNSIDNARGTGPTKSNIKSVRIKHL